MRDVRAVGGAGEPPELRIFRTSYGVRLEAHTELERAGLARRRVGVSAAEAWVFTPEDLIVYKLIAGRPRDLDDIADVVAARTGAGEGLDWEHIERWAEAWDVADRLAAVRRGR